MRQAIPLTRLEQLIELSALENKPRHNGVLLFKHSTRCIVSRMALKSLEADWNYSQEELPVYMLDVIQDRAISNQIADLYGIRHESPQILFIKEGVCVGNASHNNVSIQLVDNWFHG